MELVYLWVEDYKNIQKQGFNFSPRFECKFYDKYDENDKLEKNCKLEILDRKKNESKDNNYIENFFGENINITAIVGKNGSGKSSVLELLENKINFEGKYFLLLEENNIIYYYTHNMECITIMWAEYYECFKLGLDYKFIYINDYNKDIQINNTSSEKDEYLARLNMKTLETLLLLSDINFFKNYNLPITNFKVSIRELDFTGERYELKYSEECLNIQEDINYQFENKKENFINELLEKNFFINLVNLFSYYNSKYISRLQNYIDKKYVKNQLDYKEVLYLFEKIDLELNEKYCHLFELEEHILQYENFSLFVKNNDFKFKENSYNGILKYYTNFNISEDFHVVKEFITEYNYLINYLDGKRHDEDVLKIIDISLSLSNGVEYYNLSTGEQQLYSKIIEITHQVKEHSQEGSLENICFILDEPDNHLHPQWSREFLSLLLNTIERNSKFNIQKIHFIITTHSPFLLSDIPKQNIIFLDTYKNADKEVQNEKQKIGNCKVLSHNDVLRKKQTFGANIHTLLSDSFFMEDGLMGEFALKKIQNIVDFYIKVKDGLETEKEYKDVKKEFYFIRDNIGEEYIKGVITNHIEFIEERLEDESFKERRIKQLNEKLKELGAKYDTDLLS